MSSLDGEACQKPPSSMHTPVLSREIGGNDLRVKGQAGCVEDHGNCAARSWVSHIHRKDGASPKTTQTGDEGSTCPGGHKLATPSSILCSLCLSYSENNYNHMSEFTEFTEVAYTAFRKTVWLNPFFFYTANKNVVLRFHYLLVGTVWVLETKSFSTTVS